MRFRKTNFKKLIMNAMLFSAAFGMIAVPTVANAKHRRYHYRYTRRLGHYRKYGNQYGKWKRGRKGRLYWYKYKTGYFHNGKWQLYKSYAKYLKMVRANDKLTAERIGAIKASMRNRNKAVKPVRRRVTKSTVKAPRTKTANSGLKTLDSSAVVPASNYYANKFSAQAQKRTIADINKDRVANGLKPLTESEQLDKIAEMRTTAPGQANMLRHDDSNGTPYAVEDAKALGYVPGIWNSENIGSDWLGQGRFQNNHNGYDMANDLNNSLMNHDADSYWGHRDNILNPTTTSVGIGIRYFPKQDDFYVAEDFGQPGSAADQRADATGDYSQDKPVSTTANGNSTTQTYGNGTQITTTVSEN